MVNPRSRAQAHIRMHATKSMPNLHYGEMKEMTRLKPKAIAAKYGLTQFTAKNGEQFWFKDNGSKVLFVAHLDSVQPPGVFQPVKFKSETRIYSPTLDDRLGVYIGLCYLPKAKVNVDILLTTNEEQGASTALMFDPPKKYNWMFMFDKGGTGAVTYQYGNEQLHYKLRRHNIIPSRGTYSCIRDLEHLGCAGVNFGAAYYDYHSEFAYCKTQELRRQLRSFLDFYREYKFVSMPHDVGYERFAQAVTVQSYEYGRQLRAANAPTIPVKKEDHPYVGYVGPIRGSEDKILNETHSESDVKTLVEVDKNGKIVGYKKERGMHVLYWEIDVIQHSPVVINILRNTFNCHYVYDVVQLSPYALVNSGMLSAGDVDHLYEEMKILGFLMPYQPTGLMTPAQWERQNAMGWKKRDKILRNVGAQKPIKTNKRLAIVAAQMNAQKPKQRKEDTVSHKTETVDERKLRLQADGTFGRLGKAVRKINKQVKTIIPELETAIASDYQDQDWEKLRHQFRRLKSVDALIAAAREIQASLKLVKLVNEKGKDNPTTGKIINLFPLKGSKDLDYTLQKSRELIDAGYNVVCNATCEHCHKTFVFDIQNTDRMPNLCPTCLADIERDKSSVNQETDAEIYTKIQLRKDYTDDTRFAIIEDESKEGTDRFEWRSPLPEGKVGFIFEAANEQAG